VTDVCNIRTVITGVPVAAAPAQAGITAAALRAARPQRAG